MFVFFLTFLFGTLVVFASNLCYIYRITSNKLPLLLNAPVKFGKINKRPPLLNAPQKQEEDGPLFETPGKTPEKNNKFQVQICIFFLLQYFAT